MINWPSVILHSAIFISLLRSLKAPVLHNSEAAWFISQYSSGSYITCVWKETFSCHLDFPLTLMGTVNTQNLGTSDSFCFGIKMLIWKPYCRQPGLNIFTQEPDFVSIKSDLVPLMRNSPS